MTSAVRRNATQIIKRCVRQLLDSGEEFTTGQVFDLVFPGLCAIKNDVFESTARALVAKVCRSVCRYRPKKERQGSLFPAWDTDGAYSLGETRMIARLHAQRHHAEENLKIVGDNAERVLEAFRKQEDEYNMLEEYWKAGMTKQQAIEAYEEANGAREQ